MKFVAKLFLTEKSTVSLLLTLEMYSWGIRLSHRFLFGKAEVPSMPNVTMINRYGSFELEYPRLAFIDGSEDRLSFLLAFQSCLTGD